MAAHKTGGFAMDEFFFVKMDGLEFVAEVPAPVKPWIPGEALLCLAGDASLVAITADKLYFMELTPSGQVSRLKCFHKRGMVAHALIPGSDRELPQLRVMMGDGMKLQFQLAARNKETDWNIEKASTCAFFT